MARQRDPRPPPGFFVCPVFGRPRSFQGDEAGARRKPPRYAAWRDEVRDQIAAAIDDQSDGRAFRVYPGAVRVRLVWYTPRPDDPSAPDLDNMAKPYLDGLKGEHGIIQDDSQVRDLRILKADINMDLQDLPGVLEAKNDPRIEESAGEFVLVMSGPIAAQSWEALAAEIMR